MRTNSAPQSPPADKDEIEKVKKQQLTILRLNWLTQKGLEQGIRNELADKSIPPDRRYSLLIELIQTIHDKEVLERDEHFPAAKALHEQLEAAEIAGTEKNTQLKKAVDTSGLGLWLVFKIEKAHRQQQPSKYPVSRTCSR